MKWENVKYKYLLSLDDFDVIETKSGIHAVPFDNIKKVIPDLMEEFDYFMRGQTVSVEGVYPSDLVKFLGGPHVERSYEETIDQLSKLLSKTNSWPKTKKKSKRSRSSSRSSKHTRSRAV